LLVDIKTHLAETVPDYINTDWTVASGITNYGQYFKDNPDAKGIPVWTVTGLLAACSMPTNWFAYTPRRCISGLGWATNDTSIPYPHGETNGYTVLGGTNFPAGRTQWYTTDYGYSAATGLFSKLNHVQRVSDPPGSIDAHPINASTVNYCTEPDDVSNPCDRRWWSNHADAEANIPTYLVADWSCTRYGYSKIGYGNFYCNNAPTTGNDWGYETASRWTISVPIMTNVGFVATYYMNTIPYGYNPNVYSIDESAASNEMAFVYATSPVSGFEGYDALYAVTNWSISAGAMGATGTLSASFGDFTSPVARYGLAVELQQEPTSPYMSSKGWAFKDTHVMILEYDFVYK
jgi:hypothetical protein